MLDRNIQAKLKLDIEGGNPATLGPSLRPRRAPGPRVTPSVPPPTALQLPIGQNGWFTGFVDPVLQQF